MRTEEHRDAYARHVRKMQSAYFWRQWGPVVRVVLWGAALAVASWVWVALGNGCGDLAADEGGDGAAASDGPALHVSIAVPAPVDAEEFALAARFLAWQTTWRELHPGELAEVAGAIVTACRANPWPSAVRCPDVLAALVFRESSWRADAVGARLEVGLAQLHGAALAGETREAAMDPATNLRLALAWLRRAAFGCRLVGRTSDAEVLGAYGSGRCRAYGGARLVLRWESELRDGRPET